MATKEALFVGVDVSAPMAAHLDLVKEMLVDMCCNKLFHSKQDAFGLAVTGTAATANSLAEECGGYEHISIAFPMAPVSFKTVQAVRAVAEAADGAVADAVDAIIVCADALMKHVRKLKFNKRVILITGGAAEASLDAEQAAEVSETMTAEGIQLEVVVAGGAEAEARVQQQLAELQSALGTSMRLTSLAAAAEAAAAPSVRSVKATRAFGGALRIGGHSLPVHAWRRVAGGTSVSFKTVSKAALKEPEGEADPAGTVAVESRYFQQTEPDEDVPPDMIVNAYRFGRDLVPMSASVEEQTKYVVQEASLELLGFVPQDQVPRHLFIGTNECLVGDPKVEGAARAVQALCIVLDEEECAGLARYAPRKGATPRLVALLPAIKCLYLCPLPFADEIRRLNWPPVRTPPPTTAQMEAAEQLVDALDLQAASRKRNRKEPLRPKDIYDPQKQRTYQCIRHRALHEGAPLPPVDPRNSAALGMDADLFGDAGADALAGFTAACPIEPPRAEGTKKRTFDAASTDAGKGSEAKQAREVTGGDGAQALPKVHEALAAVDSGKPVETFWALLRDPSSDRTLEAFGQMEAVLLNLLREARTPEDALAEKGFRCLRELRKASVQEEEPNTYNELLKKLKAELEAGHKATFWEAVTADAELKKGLISSEETHESCVSAEEAAGFMRVCSVVQPQPEAPAAAAVEDEDDFDDLE